MDSAEEQRLLDHLRKQTAGLVDMVDAAACVPASRDRLARVRDALFVMQETLDTLGVPHALASHSAWREAIGTEME
ncbi:MAG TPA: hypothetical protein VFJ50_00725 [Gemmatimonadales bacterium]|nr:hypothetical protein [Gemmatimonadales bacterium]